MAWLQRLGYPLIRQALFALDAESAHDRLLDWLERTQGRAWQTLYALPRTHDPLSLAGLQFPNRVGLAAGLDKSARCLPAMRAIGFGFAEVGTVAPQGESWPARPRLFRLPQAQALINRIGYHREGLDSFVPALRRAREQLGPPTPGAMKIGVNIAHNIATPPEGALADHARCLRGVYPLADYVTINLSRPRAQGGLLQASGMAMPEWLRQIDTLRLALQDQHGRALPLFLKVSPDLDEAQASELARALVDHMQSPICKTLGWGLIATNTSADRAEVSGLQHGTEPGGLSGLPLRARSTRMVTYFRHALGPEIPIIGVGGILSADDALAKLHAGADLVQLYTGLIYRGPALVSEVARALAQARASAAISSG